MQFCKILLCHGPRILAPKIDVIFAPLGRTSWSQIADFKSGGRGAQQKSQTATQDPYFRSLVWNLAFLSLGPCSGATSCSSMVEFCIGPERISQDICSEVLFFFHACVFFFPFLLLFGFLPLVLPRIQGVSILGTLLCPLAAM